MRPRCFNLSSGLFRFGPVDLLFEVLLNRVTLFFRLLFLVGLRRAPGGGGQQDRGADRGGDVPQQDSQHRQPPKKSLVHGSSKVLVRDNCSFELVIVHWVGWSVLDQ